MGVGIEEDALWIAVKSEEKAGRIRFDGNKITSATRRKHRRKHVDHIILLHGESRNIPNPLVSF